MVNFLNDFILCDLIIFFIAPNLYLHSLNMILFDEIVMFYRILFCLDFILLGISFMFTFWC